jgi:hypothetical protein
MTTPVFKLKFTEEAANQLVELKQDKTKLSRYKAVMKILGFMQTNLRHPSLNTHKFDDMISPFNGDVFESYAQNKTPGAYRIFWVYGPGKGIITILSIIPHP